MTISVTITAENPADLHQKLLSHVAFFSSTPAPAPVAPKTAAKTGKKAAKEEPTPEPVQIDIEEHIAAKEEPAPSPEPTLTHDDVMNKLKDVLAKFDMSVVRAIIKPYGYEKINAIQAKDYADIIADADRKLGA